MRYVNLTGKARLAFAKEMIAMSQEVQMLKASFVRVFDTYLQPDGEFAEKANADEVEFLESFSRAINNQLAELKDVCKQAGKGIKEGVPPA